MHGQPRLNVMGACICMPLFPRAALAYALLFLSCAGAKAGAALSRHALENGEMTGSWYPCAKGIHSRLNTSIEGHPRMTSALILLYQWNKPLFQTSLQSYVAGGLGPRIIIIDNSDDGRVVNDLSIRCMVGKVVATKVQLSFSQLQNFMGQLAIDLQLTFYFWGHSDVAVLPSNASSSFSEEVLGCMAKWMVRRPDWGVIFYAYDLFAAFRTDMVSKVKWDTFIAHYGSDCDFYATVRSNGWRVADHGEICPEVRVKIFDLKRPLDIPYHNYNKAVKLLEQEEHADIDHNHWKDSVWQEREKVGRKAWEEASHKYYIEKWGEVGCDELGALDGDSDFHLHKEAFQDLHSKSNHQRRLLSSRGTQQH